MNQKESVMIRKATYCDIPVILALMKDNYFKEDGSGFLLPADASSVRKVVKSGGFFVATMNNEVIGCASVVEYGIAEVRSLCVDSFYRHLGIGGMLIEECKSYASSKGYKKLYALVNSEASRLFYKHGFADDNTPPQKIEKDCINCPLYHKTLCKEKTLVAAMGDF